jgi:hypothetical protein
MMARREVIEVQCDRCGRTETQEWSNKAKEQNHDPEVEVTFHAQTVVYEDLCERCRGACEGYFKSLTKQAERPEQEAPKPLPKPGLLGLGGKK